MNVLNRAGAPLRVGAAVTLVAALAIGSWQGFTVDAATGIGSGLAVVLAGAIIAVALSIPGTTPVGLLIGGGMTFSGMLAWSYPATYTWLVNGIIGLVAVVITFPWWRNWRDSLRLGTFWFGAPMFGFGAISAILLEHWKIAAGRVVYTGFALLITLMVVQAARRRGRDLTVGLAVGLLLCQALLLIIGCKYVFDTGWHWTAPNGWGANMSSRFWGGRFLFYHPNAIGFTAVLAGARIGADPRFKLWQRTSVFIFVLFMLYIVQSRTSFLMAGVAAGVYGLLYVWRRGLPRWSFWRWLATRDRRRITALAVLPLVAVILVLGAAGGSSFVFKQRYPAGSSQNQQQPPETVGQTFRNATSGRIGTWQAMGSDWWHDPVVAKLLGNNDEIRGYILRYQDPKDPRYKGQSKLGADDGPIAAGRRAGVLGLLALIAGVAVLIWRVARRDVPAWVAVTVFAGLATLPMEDELTFTTPTWAMLLAVEAMVVWKVWKTDSGPDELSPGDAAPDPTSTRENRPATV